MPIQFVSCANRHEQKNVDLAEFDWTHLCECVRVGLYGCVLARVQMRVCVRVIVRGSGCACVNEGLCCLLAIVSRRLGGQYFYAG